MHFLSLSSIVLLLKLADVTSQSDHSNHRHAEMGGDLTRILDNMLKGYDKRVRPNYGGPAVVVGLSMYVLSVSSLSERDMEFTIDMYFRQSWNDPRLRFKGPSGVRTISLSGSDFLKSIWVPDTFFVNEKTSYFHTATTSNEFLRISEEGDVLRSIRLTVTASCPMDLRYFPMDSQLCTLEIESYGYTMTDIRYKWAKGLDSIGVSSDVSLPQFKVLGHKQQAMEISLTTGNYSRLACEIQFVRSVGYYILGIYFPAVIIVMISWITFWISRGATTARVALGVTTALTMVVLTIGTNTSLPKISYIKAVDVYLLTCLFFIFASLLQSATVGYLKKQIEMRNAKQKEAMKENCENDNKQTTLDSAATQICGISPADLDKYSRMIFPLVFICFNIIYWVHYLISSNVGENDLVKLSAE